MSLYDLNIPLTRHPMVIALAAVLLAGLLAAPGWLAVNVSDLKAGQERISTENHTIRRDIAELKAPMSSRPPAE